MAKKDYYSRNPFDNEPEPEPVPPTPEPAKAEVHPESDDSILDVFDQVASVREGASGAVELERLPDPGSNPSLVSWTEVIRQSRETPSSFEGSPRPVEIDSVSDKDLLQRIVAEEQQRGLMPGPKAHETDKLGKVKMITPDSRSGSSVQLSDQPTPAASQSPSGSSVRFDAPAPPSDAGGAIRMNWHPESAYDAVEMDDIELLDELPLAEALPLDEEGSFTIAQPAHAQQQDNQSIEDEAYTELSLDADDSSKHSSILKSLMNEGNTGYSDMPVSLSSSPGSGVLSGLSKQTDTSAQTLEFFSLDDEAPLATAADSGVSSIKLGSGWIPKATAADGDSKTVLETASTKYKKPVAPTEADWRVEPAVTVPLASGDSWTSLVEIPSAEPASGVVDDQLNAEMAKPTGSSWSISDDQDSMLSGDSVPEINTDEVEHGSNAAWMQHDSPAPKSGSAWDMPAPATTRPTMPSFQLPSETAEDAVDLYAAGPFNRGISDSGTLQISNEELADAARKQKKAESSQIDLGSKGRLSSMFDLDVESRKVDRHAAEPVNETIDWSIPEGGESESSMVRRFDDISAEDQAFDALSETETTADALPYEAFAEPEPIAESLPYEATEDLYAEALPASGKWNQPRAAALVDDHAYPAEAEIEEFNQVVDEPEEAPAPRSVKKQPKEKAKRKGGGMFVGTLLGIILGGGGLFAAYYLEQLPADPKSLFGEPAPSAGPKAIVAKGEEDKPATVNPAAPVAAKPTAVAARHILETGNAAEAVAVYAQLDGATPDVLAGRGQARWLDHLQKLAKESKLPTRDDPEVAAALADLKAAAEKAKGDAKSESDAARAYLWQGMIEETFGNYAAAEMIYADAAKEMTEPTQKAIFEAASNRLQVVKPAAGAELGAIAPAHLVLAFTLVLADEPAEPKAKTDEPVAQESGFLFWEAMLLAVKHSYKEAAAKIPQVKAVHAKQQINLAGRGLNPLSDPREQMLPVCLDELQRYWAVCAQLYERPEAKMLVEQRKPAEALGALLAKAKEADDAYKVIVEKVMPKADQKIAEAIDEVLKARKDAEDGKKIAEDQLVGIGKQLKDAGIDEPKVDEGVKKLASTKADADAKVKAVAEALDKAGAKDPDLNKALTMVVASRDDAELIVKTLREHLEKAKYVEPEASKEALLKAVDESIARGAADAITQLARENKEATAKVVKLQGDLDKTKKDADELLKKTVDEADADKKKVQDDAQALVKKLEKETAEQKALYEDRLANSAKDFVLHVSKSDSLLKEGKYEPALNEYLNAVKTLRALPKEQEDLFQRIVAVHPSLQKLNTASGDPSQALKQYTVGLELYRDGLYAKAEQAFALATQYENKDARYRYYLGMARWQQNKTEPASEDFTAAAALEAQGRPTTRVINSVLEGIQGTVRTELERYRP